MVFYNNTVFREYRVEWERMKNEKENEQKKRQEEKLSKLAKDEELGKGKSVPLISEISAGRELSEIYLKHPANESSEDEEGEEDTVQMDNGKITLSSTVYQIFFTHLSGTLFIPYSYQLN